MFFLSNPIPFNGQSYKKHKRSETNHQLLFMLRNKFRTSPLFVMYYLTKFDEVMQSSFWVFPKLTFANLCKSIHDITTYSASIWPLESGKCGKEGKKNKKIKYLKKENSFFDEIKNIFHSFARAIIWWKNKNLIKTSGHKL